MAGALARLTSAMSVAALPQAVADKITVRSPEAVARIKKAKRI